MINRPPLFGTLGRAIQRNRTSPYSVSFVDIVCQGVWFVLHVGVSRSGGGSAVSAESRTTRCPGGNELDAVPPRLVHSLHVATSGFQHDKTKSEHGGHPSSHVSVFEERVGEPALARCTGKLHPSPPKYVRLTFAQGTCMPNVRPRHPCSLSARVVLPIRCRSWNQTQGSAGLR